MDKNERRICWYSALLIVVMLNTPKLLALRANGVIAQFWHFNLGELSFQIALNLAFCWLLFALNLKANSPLVAYRSSGSYGLYVLLHTIIFFAFLFIGVFIQRRLFLNHQFPRIFFMGYFARLALTVVLTLIMVRIVLMLRDSKKKELEHEQLKTAYLATELELLKEQMDPHFLFNALSSLSGVIRENPDLAQKYVRELSNVFRYALVKSKANLVTINDELTMLRSFAQLVSMRLENAFKLEIHVDEKYLTYKLPHLSLQPLLENAVKHNAATVARPLLIRIEILDGKIVISNSLWEIPLPESSNGLGLANLNERFKMMLHNEIAIEKTDQLFIVKLPLLA